MRAPDVHALPLVAYRGLWDKFAAPQTLGAIRRAYLRGVPTLARIDAIDVAEACAVVTNPATNRAGQPLFLVGSHLPPLNDRVPAAALASIYCVVTGRDDAAWPIWRWTGFQWTTAGVYLSVGAAHALPTPAVQRAVAASHVVLFESTNVALTTAERRGLRERSDDGVAALIVSAAADGAPICRVSDLVEADQLDARSREAA